MKSERDTHTNKTAHKHMHVEASQQIRSDFQFHIVYVVVTYRSYTNTTIHVG